MNKKYQSQMQGLIATQVVLNFIIGIFASKLETIIEISSNNLVIITILALFSLNFVSYRIWREEQNNSGNIVGEEFDTNLLQGSKKITQNMRVEYFIILIPIGFTLGALLAVVLVPIFSNPIKLPININTNGLKTDLTVEFAHWYELIGMVLLSIISMVVALRWHGIASLLLLSSSILSFVTIFTVLDPENHFLFSLLGWAIPFFILFALIRGIIALLME